MIKAERHTAKIREQTNRPLRVWLALYEMADATTRPIMACAVIGRACEIGIDIRVIDVETGYSVMHEAKRCDYVRYLQSLLVYADQYPVDLDRTDESASVTILSLLGYSLDILKPTMKNDNNKLDSV